MGRVRGHTDCAQKDNSIEGKMAELLQNKPNCVAFGLIN
jgi:hypothetical protein